VELVIRLCETFEEADAVDLADWLALPGAERLRIGEELRRTAFEDGEAPFVRVFSFRAPNSEE
jgi:hypothetical protein